MYVLLLFSIQLEIGFNWNIVLKCKNKSTLANDRSLSLSFVHLIHFRFQRYIRQQNWINIYSNHWNQMRKRLRYSRFIHYCLRSTYWVRIPCRNLSKLCDKFQCGLHKSSSTVRVYIILFILSHASQFITNNIDCLNKEN